MQKTITINLTPEGNLQLPLEVRDRFSNGEEYLVTTTEDTITFRKEILSDRGTFLMK